MSKAERSDLEAVKNAPALRPRKRRLQEMDIYRTAISDLR